MRLRLLKLDCRYTREWIWVSQWYSMVVSAWWYFDLACITRALECTVELSFHGFDSDIWLWLSGLFPFLPECAFVQYVAETKYGNVSSSYSTPLCLWHESLPKGGIPPSPVLQTSIRFLHFIKWGNYHITISLPCLEVSRCMSIHRT